MKYQILYLRRKFFCQNTKKKQELRQKEVKKTKCHHGWPPHGLHCRRGLHSIPWIWEHWEGSSTYGQEGPLWPWRKFYYYFCNSFFFFFFFPDTVDFYKHFVKKWINHRQNNLFDNPSIK
jgi:hypothetical protein